jgi:hypothetical protein
MRGLRLVALGRVGGVVYKPQLRTAAILRLCAFAMMVDPALVSLVLPAECFAIDPGTLAPALVEALADY